MRTGLLTAMIVAVPAVWLIGCGADSADSRPAKTDPPIRSIAGPIPSAYPRDVAAVARRPCELLTPQQAARFGFDLPPQPLDGVLGNLDCEWGNQADDRLIHISTFTNNQTLPALRDIQSRFAYFEETVIGGYPAIASKYLAHRPICNISVEPAQYQSITLTYQSYDYDNPPDACALGKQVLEAVLTNLPPQG